MVNSTSFTSVSLRGLMSQKIKFRCYDDCDTKTEGFESVTDRSSRPLNVLIFIRKMW